tara:strand:- start:10 stop:156 length:147 start_codon:yes stop_codon:yes gene_type:complete
MEYKVIEKKKAVDLENEVNKKLRNGWKLQGGLVSNNGLYAQAVVKGTN